MEKTKLIVLVGLYNLVNATSAVIVVAHVLLEYDYITARGFEII